MPYITQDKRPTLETFVNRINTAARDWELNEAIRTFLVKVTGIEERPRYSKFVTALGTIEAVRQELLHRKMLWTNGRSVATGPVPGEPHYGEETSALVEELSKEVRRQALLEGGNVDGELNFCIFRLLVTRFKLQKNAVNVDDLLRDISRQLYAEYGYPYECKKRKINGDVF